MTIQEASERYEIPISILEEYERWGLCGEGQKVMGDWHYDDTDIQRYMTLLVQGAATKEERVRMLEEKRSGTLEELHFCQRQLDRLDYLRYQIRQGKS